MEYHEFLKTKQHSSIDYGINPTFYPDGMFDFQKYVSEITIKKGRYANFLDTGTGKTLIELTVAHNYVKATNKPVLIITPLAVADQHLRESEKFGIDDVEHIKDSNYKKKIILINYERLHYLNPNDFDCVILDESSILKNFGGAIKAQITSFMKKVKYRYLFTATPSPNDFVELGTSSEALGYLGYTDMLGKFFTNNEDTVKPQNIGTKWLLKGHAEENFFKWVSSWSISMRKPSDLGFSDDKHILPKLITNYETVVNKNPLTIDDQMQMFASVAKGFKEIRAEEKATVNIRCERAIELTQSHETSVYWCNRNDEGDLLNELDKSAYQIKGSMNLDKKEEILLAFANGDIKRLITKPKMTAFGLNWQHCGHTTYFPTFSYEQYYQAIRRFWRYGRKDEVIADIVHTDGQKRIIDSMEAKMYKANKLFNKLNSSLNSNYKVKQTEFNQKILKPNFI
ncbi:DEAD/DEAH box helicase family protein [Candidatus Pacearchaeota archaeon]|nr:DEAD/DEAH box helicase family protein [Candidatus Pacearchaeota archaeon]